MAETPIYAISVYPIPIAVPVCLMRYAVYMIYTGEVTPMHFFLSTELAKSSINIQWICKIVLKLPGICIMTFRVFIKEYILRFMIAQFSLMASSYHSVLLTKLSHNHIVLYSLTSSTISHCSTHWAIPLSHSVLLTELSHYPIVFYSLSYPTIP